MALLLFHLCYSCQSAAFPPRPYAEKAKWADPAVPLGHLRDLFAKYVPPTVFELRKSFVHVVPLNTMNFVTTLCAILEVRLGRWQQEFWVHKECGSGRVGSYGRLGAGPAGALFHAALQPLHCDDIRNRPAPDCRACCTRRTCRPRRSRRCLRWPLCLRRCGPLAARCARRMA